MSNQWTAHDGTPKHLPAGETPFASPDFNMTTVLSSYPKLGIKQA